MLSQEELRRRILSALPDAEVEISDSTGTGDHFEAKVVSAEFEGKTMVQQHQMVYRPLADLLKTGELHALALKTYSPAQWKQLSKGETR